MTTKAGQKNTYDSRESWLKAAETELRPYFHGCGYALPENIRHAIAFPSTGRSGRRVGECWHCSTSEDNHFEIIIRADIAEPVEVLGVLTHELTHAALPPDAGHGKQFREAAIKLGLEGPMRHAMPNQLLTPRLQQIADKLGPLPHARLRIDWDRDGTAPADRPKKQRARLLKAECTTLACGYTVRITSKWVTEIGPPHCPRHGAMQVERAAQENQDADDGTV